MPSAASYTELTGDVYKALLCMSRVLVWLFFLALIVLFQVVAV